MLLYRYICRFSIVDDLMLQLLDPALAAYKYLYATANMWPDLSSSRKAVCLRLSISFFTR